MRQVNAYPFLVKFIALSLIGLNLQAHGDVVYPMGVQDPYFLTGEQIREGFVQAKSLASGDGRWSGGPAASKTPDLWVRTGRGQAHEVVTSYQYKWADGQGGFSVCITISGDPQSTVEAHKNGRTFKKSTGIGAESWELVNRKVGKPRGNEPGKISGSAEFIGVVGRACVYIRSGSVSDRFDTVLAAMRQAGRKFASVAEEKFGDAAFIMPDRKAMAALLPDATSVANDANWNKPKFQVVHDLTQRWFKPRLSVAATYCSFIEPGKNGYAKLVNLSIFATSSPALLLKQHVEREVALAKNWAADMKWEKPKFTLGDDAVLMLMKKQQPNQPVLIKWIAGFRRGQFVAFTVGFTRGGKLINAQEIAAKALKTVDKNISAGGFSDVQLASRDANDKVNIKLPKEYEMAFAFSLAGRKTQIVTRRLPSQPAMVSLIGQVIDGSTKKPLAGVRVQCAKSGRATTTNDKGVYYLVSPDKGAGEQRLFENVQLPLDLSKMQLTVAFDTPTPCANGRAYDVTLTLTNRDKPVANRTVDIHPSREFTDPSGRPSDLLKIGNLRPMMGLRTDAQGKVKIKLKVPDAVGDDHVISERKLLSAFPIDSSISVFDRQTSATASAAYQLHNPYPMLESISIDGASAGDWQNKRSTMRIGDIDASPLKTKVMMKSYGHFHVAGARAAQTKGTKRLVHTFEGGKLEFNYRPPERLDEIDVTEFRNGTSYILTQNLLFAVDTFLGDSDGLAKSMREGRLKQFTSALKPNVPPVVGKSGFDYTKWREAMRVADSSTARGLLTRKMTGATGALATTIVRNPGQSWGLVKEIDARIQESDKNKAQMEYLQKHFGNDAEKFHRSEFSKQSTIQMTDRCIAMAEIIKLDEFADNQLNKLANTQAGQKLREKLTEKLLASAKSSTLTKGIKQKMASHLKGKQVFGNTPVYVIGKQVLLNLKLREELEKEWSEVASAFKSLQPVPLKIELTDADGRTTRCMTRTIMVSKWTKKKPNQP